MTQKALSTPLSLNELDFYLTRAIFGIGGSFSIAVEASKAVQWLICHDIPVDQLLCKILSQPCPKLPKLSWQDDSLYASIQPLPAFYTGFAVADTLTINPRSLTLPQLDHPWLFSAMIIPALPKDSNWLIKFGTHECFSLQNGIMYIATKALKSYDLDNSVSILQQDHVISNEWQPISNNRTKIYHQGVPLQAEAWQHLWRCFHQTLVPSNPESHLQGAGAGTNDND